MTRLLPAILAMAAIVTASNILVQFLLGDWLTWGAFTYPFAFLVTDLTNRFHGPAAARRVVLAGFATGVVCSFIAAGLDKTTLRIATGSGVAFLAAQLTDVAVFHWLRRGRWWRAPLVSTLVGSALDTALFFSIAFWSGLTLFGPAETEAAAWASDPTPFLNLGPVLPFWVSLACADWSVKLALALIALVPFRLILGRLGARVA
ncbi:VUT family protein [Frigidibacter sp. ROC022]|uniref:VUT family protein n=1 Tax=Frigidibacter sp. ROC022 TaxID=2971796 RepID=UPI00215A47EB|nr:VUT family protein [Frigidibacter sp. ROC022]MCR8724712.1 VUT family protein [Frigidibacter sp. ROC022]